MTRALSRAREPTHVHGEERAEGKARRGQGGR